MAPGRYRSRYRTDLACLPQLFGLVLLLEAIQVIDKTRRRAFGYLFQVALHQRLALLFDVTADFAAEVPDHPELFGRHQVAQSLGPRIARYARRYSAVIFEDVGFAAVKLTGDAEFHGGAFQRVVFGLLDAGLGVGRAGADAFARHTVDGDCGGHRDHVADLRNVADGVRPVGRDAVQNVGHRVPFDVFDPMGVPLTVGPPFTSLDKPGIYRLSQRAQQVREGQRHNLRRLRGLRLIRINLLRFGISLGFGLTGLRALFSEFGRRNPATDCFVLHLEFLLMTPRLLDLGFRILQRVFAQGRVFAQERVFAQGRVFARGRPGRCRQDGLLRAFGVRGHIRRQRMFDGQDVLASKSRVARPQPLEIGAGTAHAAAFIAPNFITLLPPSRRGGLNEIT